MLNCMARKPMVSGIVCEFGPNPRFPAAQPPFSRLALVFSQRRKAGSRKQDDPGQERAHAEDDRTWMKGQ
jgi:hypothetical protein